MTETAAKTRKKYVPPDGKGPYRLFCPGEEPEPIFYPVMGAPGFDTAAAALKWARNSITDADKVLYVVRIVDNKKTEAVPARIRWS